MRPLPRVVCVHALDIGGEDGCVADAGVVTELECRAVPVATSIVLTEPLPLALVARQLEAAGAAGPVAAIRIGFLRGPDQAELLAHTAPWSGQAPVVLAPPVRAGTDPLLDGATREALVRHLFPVARVVVVRASDASTFTGRDVEDLAGLRDAASRLKDSGARAVVVAGFLSGGRVIDLVDDGGRVLLLDANRVAAPRVFGLAGAYAAALTSHLARGLSLPDAADGAQRYIALRLLQRR